MALIHQYFSIDTSARKVFDVNNKELYLTGNAYRVLVFLCEKKNATLTEIGTALDWAKDYDENNIRQYKYKINTIIGQPVMEYKNGIYSLIGEVKNAEKLEAKERNTSLLQPSSVLYDHKPKSLDFFRWPAFLASALLAISMARLPYGYYVFMRFAVTAVCLYYIYYFYQTYKLSKWVLWALAIIAILFNPITPVYLYKRSVWTVIDIISVLFLIYLVLIYEKSPITIRQRE